MLSFPLSTLLPICPAPAPVPAQTTLFKSLSYFSIPSKAPMPLDGVKVLDLSRVLAGPSATQMLADYGATVIAVERNDTGDVTRSWGPPFIEFPDSAFKDPTNPPTPVSSYYATVNRNKYSITCDFTNPQDILQVQNLIKGSDIVVENFRPGHLEKFNLDYESIRKIQPNVIYASLSGYGQYGPRRDEPGFDFVVQGLSGFMDITGEPDGQPQKAGCAIVDLAAGHFLVHSILAALYYRDCNGGSGQRIDVSLFESGITLAGNRNLEYLTTGECPTRVGNHHRSIVPYDVITVNKNNEPTYAILAAATRSQWSKLGQVLNFDAEDPTMNKNSLRVKNRDQVIELLENKTADLDIDTFVKLCNDNGIPASPVHNLAQGLEDPQTVARELVQELPFAGDGKVKVVGNPVKFSETPVQYRRGPRLLGEDTELVQKNGWNI